MGNRGLLKIGLIGLALVLAAEIGLRVVLGLGHPLLMAPGGDFGYIAQPNQDLHRFFSHIQINALSMRSPELPAEKPRGAKRMLFIGDSVTFGTTAVDQAEIFTSLIEHDIKATGADVEVLNASAGGWAPANERGYLQDRGTSGADMVISVINTQDLAQPFAPFQPSVAYPTRNPPSAVWELLRRYVAPKLLPSLRESDAGSNGQEDPPVETMTPEILGILSDMRRRVEAAGARYMVIYVPTASTAGSRFHEHWLKGAGMLQAWAQGEGVSLLDLSTVLAAKPSTDVYIDGTHLKPFGHRLVATAFENFYEHAPAGP